jgi:hypothetical protein
MGLVKGIEMEPGNAEFDQSFALPGCVVDAQLNGPLFIILNRD